MAQAAARGAADEREVEVRLLAADEASAAQLLAADGYLFACPENLAAMSGAMKEFFDRTYYAVFEKLNGRPYAALIAAGSDGTGAARQLARIATGWRLKPIADALIVGTGAQTRGDPGAEDGRGVRPGALRRAGAAMAAGLAMGMF